MSSDTTLFTPPAPSSPPKNFFYQVPSTPPQMKPTHAIFPWESSASKPSRVFDEGPPLASPPKFARPKDMWNSFQQQPTANEWDKLPAINRYVRQLQGPPPRPGGRRKATSTPVLVSSLKSKNPPTPCGADAGSTQGYQPTAPKKRVSWPDSSVDSSATSPVTSEHHIRDTSAATSPTTSPNFFPPAAGVPSQEEWVRFSAVFLFAILRIAYLYCVFVLGSNSPARPPCPSQLSTAETRAKCPKSRAMGSV